jgi:dCMP deaminase
VTNAGIRRIVFGEFYRDARIFDVAKQLGVELHHLPLTPEVNKTSTTP